MAASDYHDPAADLTFEQTGDEDLVTHTIVYDASYKNQAQIWRTDSDAWKGL